MANVLWTKKVQLATTPAGAGSNRTDVYVPGANGTATKLKGGTTIADSALTDAGLMPMEVGNVVYVVPFFINA